MSHMTYSLALITFGIWEMVLVLGVLMLLFGAKKLPIVTRLIAEQDLDWEQVAAVGDDLADLPVLAQVGLPATVANGVPEVRHLARWQSTRRGGEGAIREFAEALLSARGEWNDLVREYCRERSG